MESFVARHALDYLFNKGHVENTTSSSDDRTCVDKTLVDRSRRAVEGTRHDKELNGVREIVDDVERRRKEGQRKC